MRGECGLARCSHAGSVARGDVSEELTSRTIWFAEVILPGQTAQVLWPKGEGEQDIDRDCNLGFDEANAAPLKIFGNNRHQLLRKKQELGANALGL